MTKRLTVFLHISYGSSRTSYSDGNYSTHKTSKSPREVYSEAAYKLEEVVKSVVYVTSDEEDSEVEAEMVLANRSNLYSTWFKK